MHWSVILQNGQTRASQNVRQTRKLEILTIIHFEHHLQIRSECIMRPGKMCTMIHIQNEITQLTAQFQCQYEG